MLPRVPLNCASTTFTLAVILLFTGCARKTSERSDKPVLNADAMAEHRADIASIAFEPTAIGDPVEGRPWITHLEVFDLDQDGALDVLVCDAREGSVRWLRQGEPLVFTEISIGESINAPAHASACDYDSDGDWDVVVASMGQVLPNNDKIGAIIILENDGNQRFRKITLLENIARVTDVRGADVDHDGDVDLVVGQFGYVQGEINLLRNDGHQHYSAEQLLGLSGTIHTPVADLDGDGLPEIAALVSQEWEEIHIFDNVGGNFRDRVVWGSTNEDYGSSGLRLADLDRDGDLDILYTNGDSFDYALPGPRTWHGLQWLENRRGNFTFHRIGNSPGAFSPVTADLNRDGHLDIVTVSGFNNWDSETSEAMVGWINDGAQNFTAVTLAQHPTHLVTLDAADLDGDGKVELITGGFHAYPPWDRLSRITLWRQP